MKELQVMYSIGNWIHDFPIITCTCKCWHTRWYCLIKMAEFLICLSYYVNCNDEEIYSPLTERMMPWCNTFGCQFKFTVWFVKEWLSSLCGNWKGEPVSIGSLNRVFSLRWKLCSLTFPWKAVAKRQTITIKEAQSQ